MKKSQTHVEMILSFLLFVGFVTLFFVYINPFKNSSNSLQLDLVEKKLFENFTIVTDKISVFVNSTQDCYDLKRLEPLYGNHFIETKGRTDLEYILFFNKDFLIGIISCSSKPYRNYTLGSSSKDLFLHYEKIKALKEYYDSNYKDLKKSFGLNNDFSFSFRELNGRVLQEISVPRKQLSANVVSEDMPVRMIDNNGKIYEVIMNIQVW